jgi:hypothetical protein
MREQNLDHQLNALRVLDLKDRQILMTRRAARTSNAPPGSTSWPACTKKTRRRQSPPRRVVELCDRDLETRHEEPARRHCGARHAGAGHPRPGEGVTGTLISAIVLQLLSYVEIERESIKQRQTEGIASTKTRGGKFGRPRNAKPSNWK